MRGQSLPSALCGIAIVLTSPAASTGPAPGASSQAVRWDDVLQAPAEFYGSADARRIAENVLVYQRRSGGWPKNIDMAQVLTPAERQRVAAERPQADATIDNGATWRQLRYLARVFAATGDPRFRESVIAGLDFLFTAEHAKGGWPQIYPLRQDYSRHITFNDGATVNVAALLRDVARDDQFAFVDGERRARASRAVERTIRMIVAAQVRVDGQLTAWCAQHDAETLAPRPARAYEPVSLSGMESVGILEFLIDTPQPAADVVNAVEAGAEWLRRARVDGIRVERVPAPGRTPDFDLVVVADASALPLWARFYQIGTNRPIFLGRDGVVRYELAAIEHERRTGYSWLGPYATTLLQKIYPAWKARLRQGNV
jgi:PelA/Pel-15E family pectate lyase